MTRIEKTIDVDVPQRVAYDQWTQFEDFPRFMEGVERVVQRDDRLLDWTATIGGRTRTWTAAIVDQTPDVRIAWRSIEGTVNAGAVLFLPLEDGRTRIELTIDAEPEGPTEVAGTSLGFLDRRIEGDLERFKSFIEERRQPTGAWRGEVHGSRVDPPATGASTTGDPASERGPYVEAGRAPGDAGTEAWAEDPRS